MFFVAIILDFLVIHNIYRDEQNEGIKENMELAEAMKEDMKRESISQVKSTPHCCSSPVAVSLRKRRGI